MLYHSEQIISIKHYFKFCQEADMVGTEQKKKKITLEQTKEAFIKM